MKPVLSIKTRFALWYMLLLVVILSFFSVLTYYMLARSLTDIVSSSSVLTVMPVSLSVPVNPSGPKWANKTGLSDPRGPFCGYTISKEFVEKVKTDAEAPITIDTPRGRISLDQKDYITQDIQGDQNIQLFLVASDNKSYPDVVVAVTQTISNVKATLQAFIRVLVYAVPITAALAAIFGFLMIWRMLKPVNAIAKAAREIEETDLSRRIEVRTADELGKLSRTLNQTFERLQKAFQREREFTADASHELRTPLSIVQSEATLALSKGRSNAEYRQSLEVISEEVSHMSSVINKLLVLARTESGKENLTFNRVDLNRLLVDLAADIEVLCEDKQLQFELKLASEASVLGDPLKLLELFMNLVDNAIHYTPEKGSITVTLTTRNKQAFIAIADTGIGIAEEHLPHIFERFYRVGKDHSSKNQGSGLGLAICRQIVELHHGRIEVKSRLGEGSTFTVILPTLD